MSLKALIKRLQDIMRKDPGVDGDVQRLMQFVWLIFLKVYDYKEEENELDDDYKPDASIFIGQVKHLEFDLIRNQSH